MRDHVRFLLNGQVRRVGPIDPTTTLLNYLRREERLTGTKEGCAEGDCGACTVVVGELVDGAMSHRAVNACILFLTMLDGKSVTTVEHVAGPAGELHPCQQALVDAHGSQCGFCTPGFVMSLYAAYRNDLELNRRAIDDLLAGNLCRCTGYGAIVAAADRMAAYPAPDWAAARDAAERTALSELADGQAIGWTGDAGTFHAPAELEQLAALYAAQPDAVIVAGATDVGLWVTKQHRRLDPVIHLGRVAELKTIDEQADKLVIGAGVTYAQAHPTLARHFPDFGELVRRIGAAQVRATGTIGGNIANGSPIGDTPPALIALGATLVLRRGTETRRMALEDFFLDYGVQDRTPGELVVAVEVPLGSNGLRCYKVAKRFDQDISGICGCFNIHVTDGVVAGARIAFGGMAAIPKRATAVEAALTGRAWSQATVDAALPAFADDFTPIDDMRASAAYRLKVAENLLCRYYHETQNLPPATRLVGERAALT